MRMDIGAAVSRLNRIERQLGGLKRIGSRNSSGTCP